MSRHIEVVTVNVGEICDSLWDKIERHVTPEELQKAQRFASDMVRRTFLAAHGLKRLVLSRADPDIHPLAWQFSQGPHGKPAVAGRTDLHFNLSHCHGLVACALRLERPVGLDVEWLGRPAPVEIAEHFFSPDEIEWLQRLPVPERQFGFFRLWTLKEAYIKAVGLGLSQPLRDFTVSVDTLDVSFANPALGDTHTWRFHQESLESGHILAAAWQTEDLEAHIRVAPFRFD